MRFNLLEKNQALGSTYNAEVQVAFKLSNDQGQTLGRGRARETPTRMARAAARRTPRRC